VGDLQQRLGRRIRELRAQAGYSQESFGDACGMHRNMVGAIERGEQNLTLKTMQIIARQLKTTVGKLLEGLE